MIAVDVGDQNEVSFRKPRKLRGLGGIQVDDLTASFDQGAGMVERGNFNRPGFGGKTLRVGGARRRRQRQQSAQKNRQQFHG